ncbi:MAG: DUF4105 domain-containing protein [Nevskiaceae bacterium]|nr:MAG: DUF4105 domain-containing protein [Nevskiaceae bacterium]TBR71869.1 MAG: DUF4105 domain-containing protein [Nevskiaceae bacterium]
MKLRAFLRHTQAAAVIAAAFVVGAPHAAEPPAIDATLATRAQRLKLASAPTWRKLLHIPSANPHRTRSEIADPAFFLSPRGDRDPQAELDATLAAFASHQLVGGEPAQCRFHARYEWLKAQRAFTAEEVHPVACPKLDAWLKAIDPGRIYVVFASNDLDAPATMFGHTLLRIDQKTEQPGARYLAYSVNYAAQTQGAQNVGYVLRGLTGQYIGYYSVDPYYEKIQSYQGYQHRDLWEYPVRLDAAQKRMLLWHLWELRNIGSPYYFFSRNCSYALLTLLNVVEPDADLTARFRSGLPFAHAIPIDTIRALRDAGLLDAPLYEPSMARRLGAHYRQLDPARRQWVRDYIEGHAPLPTPPTSTAARTALADAMDVAHDALYYRFQVDALPRAVGLPRDHALLVARSELDAPTDFQPLTPPATSPDNGHGSARLSIGWRASDGANSAVLRWRPAYHDTLDAAPGYLVGGELEFFDLGLLVNPHRVTLADFTLLNVQQLGLRDSLFHPWSWQIAAGARRYGLDGDRALPQSGLGGYIEGGPGLAWPVTDASQFFVFPIAAFDGNPSVRDSYALGGGLRTGIAAQGPRLSTQIEGEWLGKVAGGAIPLWRFKAGLQFAFTPDNGVRLQTSYGRQGGQSLATVQLLWQHYY